MSGYIRLYRGWRDCDAFKSAPFSEHEAWLWLIENTAWKDCQRRVGKGHIADVRRGQIHVSRASLASAWSWTEKRVRGFLDRLEKCAMLGQTSDTNGSILTICNYEKYQAEGQNEGQPKGQIRAKSGPTQEEGKKGKEEKKEDASACPPDVSPAVWSDFLAVRKAKRAPITATALKGIRASADKVPCTLNAALTVCVERGWQSFDHKWNHGLAAEPADDELVFGPC